MDTRAYTPEKVFIEIIEERGLDIRSMRDDRYHAVFHLTSAAIGAEEHYSSENNRARFETLDEAREADRRTFAAWAGHRRHAVIDNTNRNFEKKMEKLWEEVRLSLEEAYPKNP
jgi:hypothetical protein